MQTAAVNSMTYAATNDGALQSQIAALRESLKNQRNRARKLWDACAPESTENAGDARMELGQFTAKLLKGQTDAAFA